MRTHLSYLVATLSTLCASDTLYVTFRLTPVPGDPAARRFPLYSCTATGPHITVHTPHPAPPAKISGRERGVGANGKSTISLRLPYTLIS